MGGTRTFETSKACAFQCRQNVNFNKFAQYTFAADVTDVRRRWKSVSNACKSIRASTLEEQEIVARRLVGTLDATEFQVLRCIVRGMSMKHAVTLTGMPLEELELSKASMMQKIEAVTTADVVRIGLNAGVELED